MRYALTAMVVALIAAIFAWVFGAGLGQAFLVYVIVGVGTLLAAALLAWISASLRHNPKQRNDVPHPSMQARKATERH